MLKKIFNLDLRSLALLRMGLGIILIVDILRRLTDFQAHYTDSGIVPLALITEKTLKYGNLSLNFLSPAWQYQLLLLIISLVASIMLLIGYKTKIVSIICYILLLSLHNRNPLILNGGDIELRVVLFWAMFLPLNARFSIDSLFKSFPKSNQYFSSSAITYILQICFIYLFNFLNKTGAEWRIYGTATEYALRIDQFTTKFGYFLLQFPQILKILTRAVLLTELLTSFVLLASSYSGLVRTLFIFSLIFMHLSFGLSMNLGLFSFISIICLLGLLPDWFWTKINSLNLPRQFTRSKSLNTEDEFKKIPKLLSFLLVGLIIYVLMGNLVSLPGSFFPFSPQEKILGNITGLTQTWNMFAPTPITNDGWYILEAEKNDGQRVDLFNKGKEISWEKPEMVSETYKNDRWRKYHMNLAKSEFKIYRPYYAKYLCNQSNSSNTQTDQIKNLKIIYMLEQTLKDYDAPAQITLLGEYECKDFN